MSNPLVSRAINTLIATVAVVVTVLSITLPILYRIQAIEEAKSNAILRLVEKGVDPIAARCSVAEDEDRICLTYVASKRQ